MSDIFIAYASEDREIPRRLAQSLKDAGWTVWWDRTIPAGRNYADVIGQALSEARCVVALWSKVSIRKDWVLEEADEGRERGVLVPTLIEDVTPPRGFRRIQTANLTNWSSGRDSPEFSKLLKDIAELLASKKVVRGFGDAPVFMC